MATVETNGILAKCEWHSFNGELSNCYRCGASTVQARDEYIARIKAIRARLTVERREFNGMNVNGHTDQRVAAVNAFAHVFRALDDLLAALLLERELDQP